MSPYNLTSLQKKVFSTPGVHVPTEADDLFMASACEIIGDDLKGPRSENETRGQSTPSPHIQSPPTILLEEHKEEVKHFNYKGKKGKRCYEA